MSLFLRHDQSAVPTEVVIVKAIQTYKRMSTASGETLQLLLKHDGGLGTTPAMLKAAKDVDAMEMLLKHEPVCQVTADVLGSAANRDIRLVNRLLIHDPKPRVTEATILAAVSSSNPVDYGDSDGAVLKLLLDQNRELKITDEMLEAARGTDEMEVLLQRRSKEQTISSHVLEQVAVQGVRGARGSGALLVPQLLKHDKSVKITSRVVRAAMIGRSGADAFMRSLFEHDPTLEITQADLEYWLRTMSRWDSFYKEERKLIHVLIEYGKTVEFTADIEKKLSERFQSNKELELKELFNRLERRHI